MPNFMSNRRMRSIFAPGERVECVNAAGTGLSQGAIYVVKMSESCKLCGDGVRLTTGPQPTDSLCRSWWRADRFRSIRPPEDELTQRIRRARPAPAQPKVTEDA